MLAPVELTAPVTRPGTPIISYFAHELGTVNLVVQCDAFLLIMRETSSEGASVGGCLLALLTRRHALIASAAATAFPRAGRAQAPGPEVRGVKLGYIALTDAAPLIVAQERGLFAKYGMPDVDVAKQASWGGVRDNLVLGGERGGIRRVAHAPRHARPARQTRASPRRAPRRP